MKLKCEPATLADLDIVYDYEKRSYHPDEAASREQLEKRLGYSAETDPLLFFVARDIDQNNRIVAFLCNTLTQEDLVTDESMKTHDPSGKTLCLHSVCVAPDMRHQGIATELMSTWIELLKKNNNKQAKYNRIALLSRPRLVGLYESVEFHNIGVSKVIHGPEPWIDCVLNL